MLGALIKNYLDERGIKYSFVANEAGISNNVFSAMLSGKRKIVAEEFIRICFVMDIDTSYFAEKLKTA